MELLSKLLHKTPEKATSLLSYLENDGVITVHALVQRLEGEPTDDDFDAFGYKRGNKRAWESLKDSVVSRVGKVAKSMNKSTVLFVIKHNKLIFLFFLFYSAEAPGRCCNVKNSRYNNRKEMLY